MKRCPKCNRNFSTETQKFCTHDGAPLVTAESGQGETVRIDSAQIEGLDNAPTRAISRDLKSPTTGQFDPYKTILAPSEETKQASSADGAARPCDDAFSIAARTADAEFFVRAAAARSCDDAFSIAA